MTVEMGTGTRRTFLGAALGGLGAWAVSLLGRPPAVHAADGGNLKLGTSNSCGAQGTSLSNLDTADADFVNGKTGVWGASPSVNGFGVQGYVSGTGNTAIRGRTGGDSTQIAVDADTTSGFGEGIALRARTKNGVGVYASAQGGYAIQAVGRTVFSLSGKVTFSTGQSSRTVTGHPVVSGSLVVATIQGDVPGTWVRGVSLNATTGAFTIRLNKAAPKQLKVGFFVIN
jgi:hypothetical protein